jgi:hypothetical protein
MMFPIPGLFGIAISHPYSFASRRVAAKGGFCESLEGMIIPSYPAKAGPGASSIIVTGIIS